MRPRLLAGIATLGVASALLTVPVASAGAASSTQSFEGFSLGSVNGQGGWQILGGSYDVAVADTSAAYGGALGTRALRISNAVTSGSFGDQLFSQPLADEAGETGAENNGLSGGTRQSRYAASFTFASADPSAEQPGLAVSISPDRGDGARMSLIRLYDTPTGLKVTALGFDGDELAIPSPGFPETVVAANLDRSVPHTFSLVLDLPDGPSNDRLAISVDGATRVVVGSWEQYFREAEGNPTKTVDSLLFRSSGTARPANAGKGFFIDALSQQSTATPTPVTSARTLDPTALATHVGGWQAFRETDWPSSATGAIVTGPSGSLGDGSFRVDLGPVTSDPATSTSNNGKYYLGRSLPGVPLADLTGLSYRVLTDTANAGTAQPYTMLTVAGGGATYANLVYDPSDPASNPSALPTTNGVWRTFDPFSPTAKWRNSRTLAGKPAWTYRSLIDWMQLAPDLALHPTLGGVYLAFGASGVTSSWTNYVAHVDGLDLTVSGTRAVDSFAPGDPLSPSALVASDIEPTRATLSWTPDAGTAFAPVGSYEVVVDGTPQTVSASTLTLDVTTLAPGSTHRASVRAVLGPLHGPWVSTSFETPTIPVPASITGLVAGSITTSAATVTWDAPTVVGAAAVDKVEIAVDGVPSTSSAPATTSRALRAARPGHIAHGGAAGAQRVGLVRPRVGVVHHQRPRPAYSRCTDAGRRRAGPGRHHPLSWTPNSGDSTDFPVTHWVVTVDGADEGYLAAATHAYSVAALDAGRHTIAVRGLNALGSSAFAAQVVVVDSQNASLPTAELTAAPATVRPGSSTTLTSVFGLDGVPASDAAVTLWRKSGSTWALVTSSVTDEDGVATFVVEPTATTRYRAVTAGLPSAYVTVTVADKKALAMTGKVVKKRTGALTRVTVAVSFSPRAHRRDRRRCSASPARPGAWCPA